MTLASCSASSNTEQTGSGPTAADARTAADGAAVPDARSVDAAGHGAAGRDAAADAPSPLVDASAPSSDASVPRGDAGAPVKDAGSPGGAVACYSSAKPEAECTLPDHCCFTNYTSSHDGSCSASACTWGTIDCDGPEDCPTGERCCAHVLEDPDNGITGYRIGCQATACGPAPANEELCHPAASPAGTCSDASRKCVSANTNDYDLPPVLSICQ